MSRRRPRESGHVMIVALFVLIVVMTAALLTAMGLNRRFQQYRDEMRDVELRAQLDAGLAETLSRLWSDPNYEADGRAEPFGDGTVAVKTDKKSGLLIEVTVQATYWGGRRAAVAIVKIDRHPDQEKREPPRVLRWEPAVFDESLPGESSYDIDL